MSVCGLINQSANMVMSHALPKKESKTMIIWKSGFTLSGIRSPVPWGYFFVKFRQIMAAQSALVTFSKDSALSSEPIIFLDKYNTSQHKIDEFCRQSQRRDQDRRDISQSLNWFYVTRLGFRSAVGKKFANPGTKLFWVKRKKKRLVMKFLHQMTCWMSY